MDMYDFLDKIGLKSVIEAIKGKLESYVFYAECTTARNVAAKAVTCDGFALKPGAVIAIRFTDTTTANPSSGYITLNINNTGVKNIVSKENNSIYAYNAGGYFYNNRTLILVYNGTYFVHLNQDNNTTYNDATTSAHGLLSVADKKALDILKSPLATCATARATAAKVATLANFSLTVGATIAVKFTATDTTNPASGNLTLNVNNTGAKTIAYFRNGSKAALIYNKAGYFYNNLVHIFTYDGTYWVCMDWGADTNTDTKVTAVGNHYTPAKSTTKSASGGTLTDITNSTSGTQVITGVEMDAKGHVTGVTSVALKSTDTKVTVDTAMSSTSTNPVQNKAINGALTSISQNVAKKADIVHTHAKTDITDLPLISNPNLLINPDFKINQRGQTSFDVSYSQGAVITASQTYTVDRWRIISGKVNITDGKFVLDGTIIQVLENSIGTDFTASISVSDGSATASYDDTTKTFTITGTATLNWAKLEVGDVATPFIAPDPVEELRKCQRYYRVITNTIIQPYMYYTNLLSYFIPIKDMRDGDTAPTVKISGTINNFSGIVIFSFNGGAKYDDIDHFTQYFARGWGVHLNAYTVFNPTGLSGTLRIADGAKITIDAEIY